MKLWKVKIYLISKEFFQYSLIAYLFLLLAETIKEGFVSFFFNLNILLGVVLVSGVVMVLTHNERLEQSLEKHKDHKIRKRDIFFLIVLSLGGAFLVLYKTIDLGYLSFLIAVLAAIIIILLGVLILTDKE